MLDDTTTVDHVLRTTRAVRRRLDLEASIDLGDIRAALEIATQAPSGNSAQDWRFAVVTDSDLRAAVGAAYREAFLERTSGRAPVEGTDAGAASLRRVRDSAHHLAEIMGRVPVLVLACLASSPPVEAYGPATTRFYASIYPAVWSFQLALRARGYGSCLTTVGTGRAAEITDVLQLPSDWTQCALIPVARSRGTDFAPAVRQPLDEVTLWR